MEYTIGSSLLATIILLKHNLYKKRVSSPLAHYLIHVAGGKSGACTSKSLSLTKLLRFTTKSIEEMPAIGCLNHPILDHHLQRLLPVLLLLRIERENVLPLHGTDPFAPSFHVSLEKNGKTLLFDGGSIGWLFLLVKGSFLSCQEQMICPVL
jgi:hypothetical protein